MDTERCYTQHVEDHGQYMTQSIVPAVCQRMAPGYDGRQWRVRGAEEGGWPGIKVSIH